MGFLDDLSQLSPVQLMPGGTTSANEEKMSLPELLLNVLGAGETARRRPLGAMLSTLGDAFGDSRQQRGKLLQQKALGAQLSKIPGLENFPPELIMSPGGATIFSALQKSQEDAEQKKMADEYLKQMEGGPGATGGGSLATSLAKIVDPTVFKMELATGGDIGKALTQGRLARQEQTRDERTERTEQRQEERYKNELYRQDRTFDALQAYRSEGAKRHEADAAERQKRLAESGKAGNLVRQANIIKSQVGILTRQIAEIDKQIADASKGWFGGNRAQKEQLVALRAKALGQLQKHNEALASMSTQLQGNYAPATGVEDFGITNDEPAGEE